MPTTIDPTPRTFDRVPSLNPKRLSFYAATSALNLARPPRSYSYRHIQLDQGQEGACVDFAICEEAAARPVAVFGDPKESKWQNPEEIQLLNRLAFANHQFTKKNDPFPGEDYSGTTLDAGMRTGVECGWFDSFFWLTGSPEEMARQAMVAIGWYGPVVFGTVWTMGMSRPTPQGFLTPQEGEVRGGHAWLGSAVSLKRNAIWTPNTWGGYGQGWITQPDLAWLLAQQGEGAIPLRRKIPTTTAA